MTADLIALSKHLLFSIHSPVSVMGHSNSMSPSSRNGGPCSYSFSSIASPQRTDNVSGSAIAALEKPVHHDNPVEPVRVKLQDPIGYPSDSLWSSEGLKSRSSLLFSVHAANEHSSSFALRAPILQSKADSLSMHSAQTTPPSEPDEGEIAVVDNQDEDHNQYDTVSKSTGELSTSSWKTTLTQSNTDNQHADNQESVQRPLNAHLHDRESVLFTKSHDLDSVNFWKGPHNDFEEGGYSAIVSPATSPDKESYPCPSIGTASTRLSRGDSRFLGCCVAPEMSLIDRIQEDFPRTPSPEYGQFEDSGMPVRHSYESRDEQDQSVLGITDEMGLLRYDNYRSALPYDSGHWSGHDFGTRQPQHACDPRSAGMNMYPHTLKRSTSELLCGRSGREPMTQDYSSLYGMESHGVQSCPGVMGAAKSRWSATGDMRLFQSSAISYAPSTYAIPHPVHNPATQAYPVSYAGEHGSVKYTDKMFKARPSYPLVDHALYELHGFDSYVLRPQMLHRTNVERLRRNDFEFFHPVAHSYSSNSLLEEFNSTPKSEKWGLSAIKGHLFLFAKDQTGSRFIQQKLEKADERVKADAFNEIFPNSLMLMTDVFGNYVIQKFLEYGSLEQQQLLVELMTSNMISLALQVYGCRVIQRALEVTQVEEQLALIQQLEGHVTKCVVDQNGNHVLQKCIEAASWKRAAECNGMKSQLYVTGKDIQFIIDCFVGRAAALSTHSYGCRVIQRVLEHCAPEQIRPLMSEIIFKCRDLVKDQFGNYVVQHVISHGEPDQRNYVMQAVLPEIARWSQHKYASNVVESCLEHATKEEISQIIDFILRCDDSGASCALLPMMKHMYGNYVVQKLLERADDHDRHRIVCIIRHNEDYLKRFTFGKHVLSRLEREEQANKYF